MYRTNTEVIINVLAIVYGSFATCTRLVDVRHSAQSIFSTAKIPGIFIIGASFGATFVRIQINFIINIALDKSCNLVISGCEKIKCWKLFI